jgi:hypothetical protein
MQESVKRYGESVRRQEGILPQIRVGLNSGEVVVRSIASDLHIDYTAVGETTHLAARVEQAASPASVLITAATLQLAEGYVEVTSLGPVRVKGRGEPVEVYELTGAGTTRSRFQVAAGRGLTRFVGRSGEIERLGAAVEESRAGRGQVVAVVGEAGVGKSRLLWQFMHSHRSGGCLILEAASVSYGRATSYLPVIELLNAGVGGWLRPGVTRIAVLGNPALAVAPAAELFRHELRAAARSLGVQFQLIEARVPGKMSR